MTTSLPSQTRSTSSGGSSVGRNNFGLSSFFLRFSIATFSLDSERVSHLAVRRDGSASLHSARGPSADLLASLPSQVLLRASSRCPNNSVPLPCGAPYSLAIVSESPTLGLVRHWHADQRDVQKQIGCWQFSSRYTITRSPPPSEVLGRPRS